ncbi:hypothetical protein ACOQFL_19910 [Actinopolyspora sp. H202]|uniref:hypothetical protein n=1 Tax=Actinopolyspora sp. H202 TaxID=1500456 RepID=UPI003EE68FDA
MPIFIRYAGNTFGDIGVVLDERLPVDLLVGGLDRSNHPDGAKTGLSALLLVLPDDVMTRGVFIVSVA